MPAIKKGDFGNPIQPKVERVPLPEMGDGAYCCLRELSARDLVEIRKRQGSQGDTDNLPFVYDLLARTISDDGGTLVFESAEDCRDNFGLAVATLTLLADRAVKLAGLEAQEKN